jgi:hypothetical protein
MSKSHPVGSLEHALAYAVQCLGMETVAGICDRSSSAIYRGINPDDPLKLSWLTVEHVRTLGQALLSRNKPEFFSSAIRQQIENEAFPEGYRLEALESPTMTLAEASEQLSRALRLVAGSLGRGDQPEALRDEQALMIVEALESAMSYAKRAKMAVLRYTRDELGRREIPAASGRRPRENSSASNEDAARSALPPLVVKS